MVGYVAGGFGRIAAAVRDMTNLTYTEFVRTWPPCVLERLPAPLRTFETRQPFRQIIQLYDSDRTLHYELGRATRSDGLELGLHFESRDKELNQFLLEQFRRHLLEIKHELGPTVEAEPWDRGWTKVYDIVPVQPLTTVFQAAVAARMAEMIVCLHPVLQAARARYDHGHRPRQTVTYAP